MVVSVKSTIHKVTSEIANTSSLCHLYCNFNTENKRHFITRSHNLPTDLEGNSCSVSTRNNYVSRRVYKPNSSTTYSLQIFPTPYDLQICKFSQLLILKVVSFREISITLKLFFIPIVYFIFIVPCIVIFYGMTNRCNNAQ